MAKPVGDRKVRLFVGEFRGGLQSGFGTSHRIGIVGGRNSPCGANRRGINDVSQLCGRAQCGLMQQGHPFVAAHDHVKQVRRRKTNFRSTGDRECTTTT